MIQNRRIWAKTGAGEAVGRAVVVKFVQNVKA